MICGKEVTPWILKCYLVLLNIWIVVSSLMIAGILFVCPQCDDLKRHLRFSSHFLQYKPRLILSWLIWCLGGLLFDFVFLCWWIVEVFTGDAIEAVTNIMISFLTMSTTFYYNINIVTFERSTAIEFGFIYVIYNVYMKMSQGSTELEDEINVLERFSNYIF